MKAPSPLPILCVLLLSWPGAGQGQAVYKSVDRQGNVTYSSTPPSNAAAVEPIAISPDASTAAGAEAERLRQDIERQAAEVQRTRDGQNAQKEQKAQRAAAVAGAEKRLRAAREGLEAAKRQRDEARKTLERGSAADGQAGYERVQREARKVREAEQALQDAKSGRLPAESGAQPETPAPTKGASPPAGGAPGARSGSPG